jgi:hypothetical protein
MNFLLGGVVALFCTLIQALIVAGLVHFVGRLRRAERLARNFASHTLIFCTTAAILFFGMFVQISVWAFMFYGIGELDSLERAYYFSMVNFTTLGYGDIVLSPERAILGPLEAANGVLMLGLSTSSLFAIVNLLIQKQ